MAPMMISESWTRGVFIFSATGVDKFGFCCFSVRFFILLDLIGTVVSSWLCLMPFFN